MTDQPLPLKPCPFCGSNELSAHCGDENYIGCKCGARGKEDPSYKNEIKYWQNAYCWKLLAEKDSEIASLRQGKQVAQEAVLSALDRIDELADAIRILTEALEWSHPKGTPAEHERLKALDRVRGK